MRSLKLQFYFSLFLFFLSIFSSAFELFYIIYYCVAIGMLIFDYREPKIYVDSSIKEFKENFTRINLMNIINSFWLIATLILYTIFRSPIVILISWLLFIIIYEYYLELIVFKTVELNLTRYLYQKNDDKIISKHIKSLVKEVIKKQNLSEVELKEIFKIKPVEKHLRLYNLARIYLNE